VGPQKSWPLIPVARSIIDAFGKKIMILVLAIEIIKIG